MPEYVVISTLRERRESLIPFREAHLSYMAKLKQEGKLRLAGRFTDGQGGLYILIANSIEEAKALAEADPYHSNKLREYTVREWEQRF
jgi:uncharacterized protein YciI